MARNECLWLKINTIHTLSENLESCKSSQPNSFSGNAIKTSPPQNSQGVVLQDWYHLHALGSLGKPDLGMLSAQSLSLWVKERKDLCRILPCMHCVNLLEPGTRKQLLVIQFVHEIKGSWKEGKRIQVQEVRLPETWRSPKRNRKQILQNASVFLFTNDDLNVKLGEANGKGSWPQASSRI